MEKHVYFVRHGESESNADGIFRGKDAVLTERGKVQAQKVAERIERIGVEAIVSSTFPRAIETASIIGERLGVLSEEHDVFGEWTESTHVQGMHHDDPVAKEWRDSFAHMAHDAHHRHGDEETFVELLARASVAIELLSSHPAHRICVVTHGGFLKMLVGVMVFGQEFSKALLHRMVEHMPTTNTGVTYVRRTPQHPRWQLVTWNDQSHLG